MFTEKKDRSSILLAGQMRLPSIQERKPHDLTTRAEAFRSAAFLNSISYLKEHFLEVNSLYSAHLEHSVVKTIRPTSPFGYGGLMVFAAPDRIETPAGQDPNHFVVDTRSIYDFSTETQLEYFKQIFAALRAFTNTQLPDRNGKAQKSIVIENSMFSVTDEKYRMGRSIA